MIRYAPALLLLAAAACSSGGSDKPAGGEASATADTAAKVAEYEKAVRCQANLSAVGRVFAALADQDDAAKREQMTAIAAKREQAAGAYRDLAKKLGTESGRTEAEVATAISDADAAIKAEFDKRPFEDFAVWVGKEADGCPPPA